MICPQTRMECIQRLNCDASGCYKQAVADPVVAKPAPPPPTLAEIGGLAVAYGNACVNFSGSGHGSPDVHFAALMAAIRAYGRE